MRKSLLMLWLMSAIAVTAMAFPVNFKWNIAGAVDIMKDSNVSGEIIGPDSDDATSFSFDAENSVWVYVVAKDGYRVESATFNGETVRPFTINGRSYVGKFASVASKFDVTLVPIDRSSSLTIDVENGADYIKTEFNTGATVALSNGLNTIDFDPAIETDLSLTPTNGPTDFYSITLNGTELKKRNQWSSSYEVSPLTNGDRLVIRVFEGEEPVVKECTVSVVFETGMEDCITSIYNRSTSEWLELENNCLTVKSGLQLQFNFNTQDYNYTRFLLDGKNVTGEVSNGSLRFFVEEDTELFVGGTPKEYPNIDFTAYVTNPEGVLLYLGQYQQNETELTGGTAIDDPITLETTGSGEFVMSPDDTMCFTVPVSSRRPFIYIAPKDGWYIYTVQGMEDEKMIELPYITTESLDFYVVALPFDGFRSMEVDIRGGAPIALSGSSAKSLQWSNPDVPYELTEGVQQVEFLPGYNLPLSLRSIGMVENMGVYLDGVPLNPDENNVYVFTPWYPADGEEQEVESTVTVICDGSPARTSRVRLQTEDDMEATAYYSAVGHELNADGQTLLSGTLVKVVPANKDCTITLNGNVVNGLDAGGSFLDGLTAEGVYLFDAPTGTATIVVSKGCGYTGVDSVLPSEDKTVEVFTIDGRRISLPDDVRSLPRGLYIIAGRKVII